MTGPKHFKAAESCLNNVADEGDSDLGLALLAEAQVHATLALVAAQVFTALNTAAVYNVELNAAAEWVRTTQ